MFQVGGLYQALRLEHKHEDGTWASFEPRPSQHDAAEHDPERSWAKGRIYACTSCDEQILVSDASDEGSPGAMRP